MSQRSPGDTAVTRATPAGRSAVVTTVSPARDARVAAYLAAVGVCLLAALASGRPEPAAAAAPFVVALILGLRHARAQTITVHMEIDRPQVLEGDTVTLNLRIERPSWMRADVLITPGTGIEPASGAGTAWSFGASLDEARATGLRAVRWGRLPLGTVAIRGRARFGLLRWSGEPVELPVVRVLPTADRLRTLLHPAVSHASAGAHLARRRLGHGSEFAEIRPYQPGDRLRDLNWAASARRQAPHVNRHHPELGGDVVVMIDTAFDAVGNASPAGQEALVRCARAAWAIAGVHLAAQDRVGLLTTGRVTKWLAPAGGIRARYELLETLLDIGAVLARRGVESIRLPEERVPPAALVVGLTPLWEDRFSFALVNLARRGRRVAALVLDPIDLLPPPTNHVEELARRVFALAFQDRVARLRRAGVPTVVWPPEGGAAAAITTAARQSARATSGGR